MIGLPSLRALDGAQVARIWLAAEATDMRCGFDRFRGTAPGTAPEAVGPTAGPVARSASDVEGATAAQASHGRGNQLCPWPVGGTERVLLRWRSPHRQERQRARDQARGAQSQELPVRGKSARRQNGGDPDQPDQHLPPSRRGPATVSHATANESIADAQKRVGQLAPGPVEAASGRSPEKPTQPGHDDCIEHGVRGALTLLCGGNAVKSDSSRLDRWPVVFVVASGVRLHNLPNGIVADVALPLRLRIKPPGVCDSCPSGICDAVNKPLNWVIAECVKLATGKIQLLEHIRFSRGPCDTRSAERIIVGA